MNEKERAKIVESIHKHHKDVKAKTEFTEITFVKIGFLDRGIHRELRIDSDHIAQTRFLGSIKQLLARFL